MNEDIDWLDAYLGEFVDQVTQEQREQLLDVEKLVSARYPQEDGRDTDACLQAFAAATEIILGDMDLKAIADEWWRARLIEREKMQRLTGAIIAAHHTGLTQQEIVDQTDINRMTVRKALGK